jgi:hypothetical protein
MGISIGTTQIKNGIWKAHAVCSGADMAFFYAKTQQEAWEMAKKYLDKNYFSFTTEEINKRVELRKAQE